MLVVRLYRSLDSLFGGDEAASRSWLGAYNGHLGGVPASARDVEGGANIGLFTPRAFAARRPRTFHAWICVTERAGVELFRKDPLGRESLYFPRQDFEIDGALPAPAL